MHNICVYDKRVSDDFFKCAVENFKILPKLKFIFM